jgi:hypothetical protein
MKYCTLFLWAALLAIFTTGVVQAEGKKPAEQGSLSKAIVDRFDTNGNGQIDDDEAAAARTQLGGKGRGDRAKGAGKNGPDGNEKRREAMLKRFDANGNGQLDPPEREAAKAAMEKLRGEKGKGKGKGNGKGARGPGGPASGAMKEALIKRFDANGNGQLDPDEIQTAKAELQKLHGNKVGKK